VGAPRSIRERFPPPWRLEDVPGGFRVTDAHGRPLAYVYGVDGGAQSALPGALTTAEALALARAIERLPEIMPALVPYCPVAPCLVVRGLLLDRLLD
jgi:hypothetical protein